MKKFILIFLYLFLFSITAYAEEQPPYWIKDPASNENFKRAFYLIDQHKHNEDESSRLNDCIPETDSIYDLGTSSKVWDKLYVNRVMNESIWHVTGTTYSISTTIPITQNVWATITNATNNLWQGVEADGFSMVTDSMVITNPGDYAGIYSISYSANNGNDWMFRIYNQTDAKVESIMNGQTTTGSTNIVSFTTPFYFEDVHSSGTFVLQTTNTSSNDDMSVKSTYFYCYFLHK